jgi:sortase A
MVALIAPYAAGVCSTDRGRLREVAVPGSDDRMTASEPVPSLLPEPAALKGGAETHAPAEPAAAEPTAGRTRTLAHRLTAAARRAVAPRVVPLRPDPTPDGYRSVHADLTRTGARSLIRGVAHGATELLITLGVIAMLFVAYQTWGASRVVESHQRDLDRQLAQQWAAGSGEATGGTSMSGAAVAPPPGGALARLYLPRLDKAWVVVEGVGPADLRYGPGHYPATARPGQVGNFAMAGHRTQAVFWNLDRLTDRDVAVVETARVWYVYRITQVHVTSPNALEVLAPVPGRPGVTARTPMLTLTTCSPKWGYSHRLVVHAELVRSQPRTAGRPAELTAA